MKNDFSSIDIGEDFMAHYGVKGMRWGVRRDPESGVRPIAKALDESWFGRAAKANVNRHMRRQNTKAAARGDSGPHKSTSNNPDRKTINRNAAIDAARAAGVNIPKESKYAQLTPAQKRTRIAVRTGQAFLGAAFLTYGAVQLKGAYDMIAGSRAADRRLVDFNNRRTERWGDTARSLADEDKRAAARLLYENELKSIRDILDGSN